MFLVWFCGSWYTQRSFCTAAPPPTSSYVSFLTPTELDTAQPQKTSSRPYVTSKRSRISTNEPHPIFQMMCVILYDGVGTGYQLDTRDILASILFPQSHKDDLPYHVYFKNPNRNMTRYRGTGTGEQVILNLYLLENTNKKYKYKKTIAAQSANHWGVVVMIPNRRTRQGSWNPNKNPR